jgi:hypothetical protein
MNNKKVKLKKIKSNSYANAEVFRYENTRVQIVSLPTEDYGIELVIRTDDLTPRTIHTVKKDKIVSTLMKISKEAAISIMIGIQNQLKKDGVI